MGEEWTKCYPLAPVPLPPFAEEFSWGHKSLCTYRCACTLMLWGEGASHSIRAGSGQKENFLGHWQCQGNCPPQLWNCSHSPFKGSFSFLPTVLCPCRSIHPKCSSLTLYLANTFSFIGPHPAQMFLLHGSSELPSSLGFLFYVSLAPCVPLPQRPPPAIVLAHSVFLFGCTLHDDRDPVRHAQRQVPAPGTAPSTQHVREVQEALLPD